MPLVIDLLNSPPSPLADKAGGTLNAAAYIKVFGKSDSWLRQGLKKRNLPVAPISYDPPAGKTNRRLLWEVAAVKAFFEAKANAVDQASG
jgi:hypothetical protein